MTDSDAANPRQFEGKSVVVTGGGAGIGRAIALAFASAGARVALAGRNLEAAEHAAAEIADATGGQTHAVRADVSRPEDCAALIEAGAARFGALDILVANAAHFALLPLLDARPEDVARFLDTNLCGPLFCGQAFARRAIAGGRTGVIVNIGSIAGARPAPGCGLYSASKAALVSLTRTMALEWGPRGVRVNAVAPGHVATPGVEADFAAGRLDRAAMIARIPAGRIAEAADIADAVLFLASARARHVVGAVLTIDGGESM
ncbi:MAG: SDR family oxidoreductase [Roseiarcus sp.]|jgi:NAD(P)-dependent dehydrogenase (short-subunit alcohol dehydrogenase family)